MRATSYHKILVEHGGQIQSTDILVSAAKGNTPSTSAAGRIEVVEYLLDCSAPIDAMEMQYHPGLFAMFTPFGLGTALYEASRKGNQDVVTLLLDRGASRDIKDTKGKTALDIAEEAGLLQIAAILRNH